MFLSFPCRIYPPPPPPSLLSVSNLAPRSQTTINILILIPPDTSILYITKRRMVETIQGRRRFDNRFLFSLVSLGIRFIPSNSRVESREEARLSRLGAGRMCRV